MASRPADRRSSAPASQGIGGGTRGRVPPHRGAGRRWGATAGGGPHRTPAARAQALGTYAALDPGACTGPIASATLRDRAHDLFSEYPGPPPSLREPFCDGTLYAPTDPGQDPRHVGTLEPSWNMFDLTRHGRQPDWDEQLQYPG